MDSVIRHHFERLPRCKYKQCIHCGLRRQRISRVGLTPVYLYKPKNYGKWQKKMPTCRGEFFGSAPRTEQEKPAKPIVFRRITSVPPRRIALKGLEWDYLSKPAQRAIVTRVTIAENNVVAAAEEWAKLRFRNVDQMGSLRAHLEAEGSALGALLYQIGHLNEMRVIRRDDLDYSDRTKRQRKTHK